MDLGQTEIPRSKGKRKMSKVQKFRDSVKLTNRFRKLVSGSRSRLKEGTYNLDLSYVTDNIIAMGLPSSGFESLYRNNIDDVSKYLNTKHEGHYNIYNLSERTYNVKKFKAEIIDVKGWADHSAPPLHIIFDLVKHMEQYLYEDTKNVSSIHCKAGKGRTGTMICAFLLKQKIFSTVKDAMEFFVTKRSSKNRSKDGVTIPSQIRYLGYYLTCLQKEDLNEVHDFTKSKRLSSVEITNYTKTMKKSYKQNSLTLYVYTMSHKGWNIDRKLIKSFPSGKHKSLEDNCPLVYDLGGLTVTGDVYIEGRIKKTKILKCFFHPSFHQDDDNILYTKMGIDIAKKKKHISEKFSVHLAFGEGLKDSKNSVKFKGEKVTKLSKAFQSSKDEEFSQEIFKL